MPTQQVPARPSRAVACPVSGIFIASCNGAISAARHRLTGVQRRAGPGWPAAERRRYCPVKGGSGHRRVGVADDAWPHVTMTCENARPPGGRRDVILTSVVLRVVSGPDLREGKLGSCPGPQQLRGLQKKTVKIITYGNIKNTF